MSDFKAKCTKINFGRGSAPDPLEELTALPQTPWDKADLLLRESERCKRGRGG